MLMTAATSSLVLIDPQQKLMPAINDGSAVVTQCLRLANIATQLGVPVVGTEQNPDRLGPNVESIRNVCGQTIPKQSFDATADGLLEVLPPERKNIVIAGCEAHVCVLQTALGLITQGYTVWVVGDAVGSRQQADRDAALQRLVHHGAQLVTVEMVAFEWLRRSDHPRFRDALRIIK